VSGVLLLAVATGCAGALPKKTGQYAPLPSVAEPRIPVELARLRLLHADTDELDGNFDAIPLAAVDLRRVEVELREAVQRDLWEGGPFRKAKVGERPYRLEVEIERLSTAASPGATTMIQIFDGLLLFVPVLLGSPLGFFLQDAEARFWLTGPAGALVHEAAVQHSGSYGVGIYYGQGRPMGETIAFLVRDYKAEAERASSGILAETAVARTLEALATAPPAAGPSASTPPAPREPSVVVAVFGIADASNKTGAHTLSQLNDYLESCLSSTRAFKVVPRSQLRAQLTVEKRESYKTCYDESCQIELGKAVAAQKSLSTKILRVGKTCALTAQLYDLRSEATERAAQVQSPCADEALLGGIKELVRQLAQD
jgi:hypothetical protein